MTDPREFSRLPADARYWDGLEARIMEEMGPRVRAGAAQRVYWWTPLAARAWGLSGLAAAAAVAFLLLTPGRSPGIVSGLLWRMPDDPALATFLSSTAPPPVAALVIPARKGGPQ
jgi:hypothetical protein